MAGSQLERRQGGKMDYQEKFEQNKVKVAGMIRELNMLERRKQELTQEAAAVSGEQRLLQELMKEGKKDEQKPQ